MNKNIVEERGYFWWHDEPVPENQFAPESYVTGVLTVREDGSSRLELDTSMPSDMHSIEKLASDLQGQGKPRSICGILKGTGQRILLVDAVGDGGHFHSNRFSYEKYLASYCLVGTKAIPWQANGIKFSRMEVDLAGYEDWLRIGSIRTNRTVRAVTVKQRTQKDVSFSLNDRKLTFQYEVLGPHRGKQQTHEVTLKEFVVLAFRFKRSMPIEDIRSEFHFLQDLFILLTDSHYALAWPTVSPAQSKDIYTAYFLRTTSAAPAPAHYKCPTNFIQLRESFGAIFDTWRTKRSTYGSGFYSYLSTRRDFQLYVENRFLNLVLGMESLHRKKFDGASCSAALDEKIERIIGQIKLSRDKRWLTRILEHEKEPRLEQRIFELLRDLSLGFEEERLRRFSKACAARRNDLSHFGGERVGRVKPNFLAELDIRSDALAVLYHVILLKEIGIDDDCLRQWVFESFGSHARKHALVATELLGDEVLQPTAHHIAPGRDAQ